MKKINTVITTHTSDYPTNQEEPILKSSTTKSVISAADACPDAQFNYIKSDIAKSVMKESRNIHREYLNLELWLEHQGKVHYLIFYIGNAYCLHLS